MIQGTRFEPAYDQVFLPIGSMAHLLIVLNEQRCVSTFDFQTVQFLKNMMTESNSTSFTKPELPMTIQTIREYLPHRYPFLLVDRVVDVTENGIVAYKNVSINEEFLQGHFPNYPIMPGVLIVEALAQVSGILGFIMNNEKPSEGSLFLFAGAEKVRFKKQVVAGDQLVLKSELVMQKRGIYKYNCIATVDGVVAASAEIMVSHQKIEQS